MAATTPSIVTTVRSTSCSYGLASANQFPSRPVAIEVPFRFGASSSSTLSHRAIYLHPISATSIRSSFYPTLASTNHFPSRTTTIESPSRFGTSSSTLTHRATHLRPISAVEAPEKIEKIGSEISSLTLEEARILVDYLQDKFGVSPLSLAPAAAAVAAPADSGAAAVVEKQIEFDVVINEVPSGSRLAVIKAVRALIGTSFSRC